MSAVRMWEGTAISAFLSLTVLLIGPCDEFVLFREDLLEKLGNPFLRNEEDVLVASGLGVVTM